MGRFKEYDILPEPALSLSGVTGANADANSAKGASSASGVTASGAEVLVTNDVTIFNWTATDTTLTPTRVDTATAGTATGTITFNATDSVAASNMQTAIRALGGIYADATVVAGVTADNMIITVYGGYDITWAKSGGTGTITETGAAGSDTAVPGGVRYRKTLSMGKFFQAKKLVLRGFLDKSLDVSIVDKDSKNVYVKTGIDTSGGTIIKLLSTDGVEGSDGASTGTGGSGGVFKSGAVMSVTTSSPVAARPAVTPFSTFLPAYAGLTVALFGNAPVKMLERTGGARTTFPHTISLGSDKIGIVRKIRLEASSDTTVDPTITDQDGLQVYVKSATNYTTAVMEQLTHDGVDQADNALTDVCDVTAKFPLSVAGAALSGGTFKVTVWVEV